MPKSCWYARAIRVSNLEVKGAAVHLFGTEVAVMKALRRGADIRCRLTMVNGIVKVQAPERSAESCFFYARYLSYHSILLGYFTNEKAQNHHGGNT